MSTKASGPARLSRFDDLPVHQHADLLSRPASNQWNWTERWYFNLQAPTGELLGIIGGGIYRNTGVTESYVCLLSDNEQINHRTTKMLVTGNDGLMDGVVKFSIAKPMKVWEINAQIDTCGTSMNLQFEGYQEPFLFKPFWVGPDRDSHEFDQYEHFVQPGRLKGTVQAHTKDVNIADFISFRDRTWGVRSRRPKLHNWIVLHFSDGSYMSLVHQEIADGRILYSHAGFVDANGEEELLNIEAHEIMFDKVSRVPQEGTFHLRGSKSGVRTLRMSRKGPSIRGLGAGYDANQGSNREDSGQTNCIAWNLDSREVLLQIGRGTIDTGVHCSLDSSDSKLTGIGVWETAIGRSHYKYGVDLVAE
jgi:hypothetical protein